MYTYIYKYIYIYIYVVCFYHLGIIITCIPSKPQATTSLGPALLGKRRGLGAKLLSTADLPPWPWSRGSFQREVSGTLCKCISIISQYMYIICKCIYVYYMILIDIIICKCGYLCISHISHI